MVSKGVRYWMWAWIAQIFSAPLQSAVLDNVYLASFAHGLSVMFPVLLLAGAYYFVGRVPPRWVVIAGSSVAILRGGLAIAGFYALGRFIALPFELFAYAYSGWVIVKGRPAGDAIARILALSFAAMCAIELWDAFQNNPSRAEDFNILPWVIVLVAVGITHIFSWLQKHRREVLSNERSARDRFDALANHARDIIAEVGSDGRLLYVSPNCQPVVGIEPDQIIGKHVTELMQATKAEYDGELTFDREGTLASVVQNGHYQHLYKIQHPDNTTHFLEISASHYFTASKEMRAVAVIRDVTARMEAEQEAISRQKLESLGAMAAGIAHDFRNLLTTISGSTELLELDLKSGDSKNAHAYISNVLKASAQAAELTDQMLTYAGKTPVELREIDLNESLEQQLPLLHSVIADRAHLEFVLAADLPPVLANPVAIQQMIVNLITNASEAIEAAEAKPEKTGSIRIESKRVAATAKQPQMVELSVTDNGQGMDETTKARIFEPFFSTKFAGRGLGLAALQGLVAAHNGQIEVISSPATGTTVTISLPISNSE
jgi:PAS domain S-box-containing protein